ncbi:MAG TPA: hypothetical protein ACFCUC_15480 [Desulfobacterales bacterium]
MIEPAGKKLPTVEQVEEIMLNWGKYGIEEFARKFDLEVAVMEATVAYIRKLTRLDGAQRTPVLACFRNDSIESIVRCAGARHGYV